MNDMSVILDQSHVKCNIIENDGIKKDFKNNSGLKEIIFNEWILNPIVNDSRHGITDLDKLKILPSISNYRSFSISNSLPNVFFSTIFNDKKYYCNTKKVQWISHKELTNSICITRTGWLRRKRSQSIPNFRRSNAEIMSSLLSTYQNGKKCDYNLFNDETVIRTKPSKCNMQMTNDILNKETQTLELENNSADNKQPILMRRGRPRMSCPAFSYGERNMKDLKTSKIKIKKSANKGKKIIDIRNEINEDDQIVGVVIKRRSIRSTCLNLLTRREQNCEEKCSKSKEDPKADIVSHSRTRRNSFKLEDLCHKKAVTDKICQSSRSKKCDDQSKKSPYEVNDNCGNKSEIIQPRLCQSRYKRKSHFNRSLPSDELKGDDTLLKKVKREESLRCSSNVVEISLSTTDAKMKNENTMSLRKNQKSFNISHTNSTTNDCGSISDTLNYRKIRKNTYVDPKPSHWTQLVEKCSCKPSRLMQNVDTCDKLPNLHNSSRKSTKSASNIIWDCKGSCLNRITYTECNPKTCPCEELCCNQKIKKCDWAKGLKLIQIPSKGRGVVASKLIREGSLIAEYVGEVISETTFQDRMINLYREDSHHYCLHLDGDMLIDAYRSGSIARFVNHSCQPNCEMQKWMVNGTYRMCLFATEDISPQTELTYDYNFCSFNTETVQKCLCNSENCRGLIGGKPRAEQTESQKDRQKLLIAFGKSLSLKEKVFIQRNRIFLIRVRDIGRRRRLGIEPMKRNIEDKVHVNESENKRLETKKSQFRLQMSALNSGRYVKTRLLQNARDNENVTRTALLAQVLRDLYNTLLDQKDPICSDRQLVVHFLRKLKRNRYPELYEMVGNKGVVNLNEIYSRLMEGRYGTMLSFDSDMLQMFRNLLLYAGKKSEIGQSIDRIMPVYLNLKINAISLFEALAEEVIDGKEKDILLSNDLNIENSNEKHFCLERGAEVVKCVCGFIVNDNPSDLVQCQQCYVWQHSHCMNIARQLGSFDILTLGSYICHVCLNISTESLIREIPVEGEESECNYFRTLLHENSSLLKINDFIYVKSNDKSKDKEIIQIERLWKESDGCRRMEGRQFIRPYNCYLKSDSSVDLITHKWHKQEVVCTDLRRALPLDDFISRCQVLDKCTFIAGKPRSQNLYEIEDIYLCDWIFDVEEKWSAIDPRLLIVSTKYYCFERYKDWVERGLVKCYNAEEIRRVDRGDILVCEDSEVKVTSQHTQEDKRLLRLHLFEKLVRKLTGLAHERTRKLSHNALSSFAYESLPPYCDYKNSGSQYDHRPRKPLNQRKVTLDNQECKSINTKKNVVKKKTLSKSKNILIKTEVGESKSKRSRKKSCQELAMHDAGIDDNKEFETTIFSRNFENCSDIMNGTTKVLLVSLEDNLRIQTSFQQSTESSSIDSFYSEKGNETLPKEIPMDINIVEGISNFPPPVESTVVEVISTSSASVSR